MYMESLVKGKFVLFRQNTLSTKAATKAFDVCPLKGVAVLGNIKWLSVRYVFYPMPDTVFDSDGLKDIVEFINRLTLDRKLERQNKKLP